jgi:hypothetical protein
VNRTQLKVSALVNGLTLLEAEFANHRYERHFHDELVLAITESGSARINCWGQWFTAGSGDIFVSNPNDPQAAMTLGAPWKYRAFYLARYALDQLAHVLDLAAPGNLPSAMFRPAVLFMHFAHTQRANHALRRSREPPAAKVCSHSTLRDENREALVVRAKAAPLQAHPSSLWLCNLRIFNLCLSVVEISVLTSSRSLGLFPGTGSARPLD